LISLVIVTALLISGCGGGTDTTTTTTLTTGTTGTTATTGTGSTTGGNGSLRKVPTPSTLEVKPVEKYNDKYPDEFAVNIVFKPNSDTPQFFTDALSKKIPIFVEFYGEADSISSSMTQGISELQAKYSGKVLFILLDADNPQTYGSLSAQLPVQYIPQTFVFNKESTIIRSFTGFANKERLDQALYDAVNRGY
jgi:ABC-type glycerol-3-phosphate transport system substrate-binding protein